MLLALDARNGSLRLGFRSGSEWLYKADVGADRTPGEYAFFLEAAWAKASRGQSGAGPHSAWLSSVVPALSARLSEGVRLAFGLAVTQIGPGVRTGIKIRTDQPSEVGSDLVCMAIAARELCTGPCVVVDFGLALSLVALNAQGELLGAAIAPGLATAQSSLRTNAAQLPEVRLGPAGHAIGKNTAEALRSGIVMGYGGLIERLYRTMSLELGGNASLIASGDELGKLVLEGLPLMAFVPDLALDGIALIAQKNNVQTTLDYSSTASLK